MSPSTSISTAAVRLRFLAVGSLVVLLVQMFGCVGGDHLDGAQAILLATKPNADDDGLNGGTR